jgi:hypothetical protein
MLYEYIYSRISEHIDLIYQIKSMLLATSLGVNIGLPISLGPLRSGTVGMAKALPMARLVKMAEICMVIDRF